jgi:hypothetical protein
MKVSILKMHSNSRGNKQRIFNLNTNYIKQNVLPVCQLFTHFRTVVPVFDNIWQERYGVERLLELI